MSCSLPSGKFTRPLAPDAPVILLTPDLAETGEPTYLVRANYAEAIARAGGMALILPFEAARLEAALERADGVVIAGAIPGADVSARRLDFERALVAAALARDLPLLGICHGMQLIGEALGGTVLRDDPALLAEVTAHMPGAVADRLAHEITIAPDSHLARWSGATRGRVNSLHRHLLTEGGRFRVTAWAPDGVVEAIEGEGPSFCLGVQWHPEYGLTELDHHLLAGFVAACAARRGARVEGDVAARFAALGLTLPEAPVPPGGFVGAIRHANAVTVSGQVPLKEGVVLKTGRLGETVSIEEGQECARVALLNALAQLGEVAGGLDRVVGFVRLAGSPAGAFPP